MDGRVKRLTGRGIGLGRGATGSGGEVAGAVSVREGVANGDKGPRVLASINPGGTEALLDDKLPQLDMSEELDHPRRISELVGDCPMEDKDDEVDWPL
jgi:hypothetical protein